MQSTEIKFSKVLNNIEKKEFSGIKPLKEFLIEAIGYPVLLSLWNDDRTEAEKIKVSDIRLDGEVKLDGDEYIEFSIWHNNSIITETTSNHF